MFERGLVVLLFVGLFCSFGQSARAELNDRLSQQRYGSISSGEYQAGERVHFSLTRFRGEYLMHVAGDAETYVVYVDYGSLGGKVLRYDSGAIAIQVAGWGAMTLYTDNQPGGLPAMRIGDANAPSMPNITQSTLVSAADDEAAHLAYVRDIHISFSADWNAMTGDAGARATLYDTLGNTARGISRFAANGGGREAFVQRVSQVRFQPASKPLIQMSGRTLVVTYNPNQGYMGRASSRAIAFALGKLFRQPTNN